MKSKKKIWVKISLITFLIVIGILIFASNSNEKISVVSETFESINSWKIYDYEQDYLSNDVSTITVEDVGYNGKSLCIRSEALNDARVYKKLRVEPNSYYKVSIDACSETNGEGKGASISAIGSVQAYDIGDTDGIWKSYEMFFQTTSLQNVIELSFGLGGYSSVSEGYAFYDNLKIEKVEYLPINKTAIIFTDAYENTDTTVEKTEDKISKAIFVVCVILLLVLAIFVEKKLNSEVEECNFEKKDFIVVSILTIICACVSFYKLGDMKMASNYWKAGKSGEYVTVEFESEVSLDEIAYLGNVPTGGYYKVSFSKDNENYTNWITLGETEETATSLKKPKTAFLEWHYEKLLNIECKYVKIEAIEPNWAINEIAFFSKNNENKYEIIPLEVIYSYYTEKSDGTPEMLFDEQDLVPEYRTYMNGTYFDEVYFPRTAYEQLKGWSVYEITHPPFGKILMSLGILIFGMNPFGWRFMGTLAGVLIVPLMYIFAMKLFKNRKYAIISTFIIMLDFMRLSHSRLATIDSFATLFVLSMYFFMFNYFLSIPNFLKKDKKNFEEYDFESEEHKKRYKKSLKSLLLCGIMFGFGAATKWTCIYSGAGLAFVFFMKNFSEFMQVRKVKKATKKWLLKDFLPTCLWCVLFFVIIPITIYTLSYTVYLPSNSNKSLIEIVLDNQEYMYNYHSKLTATHPYESKWYTWPLDIRPIWIYGDYSLANGYASTIASFGNPAIWWVSTIAIIVSIFYTIRDKDKVGLLLLVAYAFQYIPWMLTTRCTFIYAYFTPIPYAILLLVYCFKKFKWKNKFTKILLAIYLLIVLVMFIKFYPVISGIPVNEEYINSLKWFETWTF